MDQEIIEFIHEAAEKNECNRIRPYAMRERIDPLTYYNHYGFKDRFRLSKAKVLELLEQIQDEIKVGSDRNHSILSKETLLELQESLPTGRFIN